MAVDKIGRGDGPGGCPPEKCYPDALTDGRSAIKASADDANRGEKGAFWETPPYAVCETAVVNYARRARLWAENGFL